MKIGRVILSIDSIYTKVDIIKENYIDAKGVYHYVMSQIVNKIKRKND